jgi:type I restriction enzyme R subunit
LERVKLGHSIELDDGETELEPQNPNPRGGHGTDNETDPLEEIVKAFNERWFQGWGATPEEQRVRFVNIIEGVRTHPDYESKYKNNADPHNSELAYNKIFDEVMLAQRKIDLEFYRLCASDDAFKASIKQSSKQYLERVFNTP